VILPFAVGHSPAIIAAADPRSASVTTAYTTVTAQEATAIAAVAIAGQRFVTDSCRSTQLASIDSRLAASSAPTGFGPVAARIASTAV